MTYEEAALTLGVPPPTWVLRDILERRSRNDKQAEAIRLILKGRTSRNEMVP